MSATYADLPDEIRSLLRRGAMGKNQDTLDNIGIEIGKKRDEAKEARTASGIETHWTEAEEAYAGIDDANRAEFNAETRMAKPMSMDGPLTPDAQSQGNRATMFIRLTARYTDAGAAKVSEILIPADDKAFSFKEMPVPEVIDAKDDDSQVVHSQLGVPLTRPPAPGEGQPGQPPAPVPLTVRDLANEHIEMARKQAKAAETRIYDWMIQSKYRAEFRKIIKDAAKLGTGVLKGPFPKSKRVTALRKTDDAVEVFIKDKIIPSCERVSVWNLFPDPSCGNDITNGDYIFERDYMSARQVRGLKKLPGYIARQIDRVLLEGPDKANNDDNQGIDGKKNKDRYTIWYFYGALTKDEVAAINEMEPVKGYDGALQAKEVFAIVTLINDSVVRATINPLDSGSFPYHAMPWQERDGHWAGVGVPEQMKTPQRITNAALRALLNNAGKSSDNQYVIDGEAIWPADEDWTITPGKIWRATGQGERDMGKAFLAIPIPNTGQALERIIELGERFAEETTSIPLISQGQSGATTPDTFGAAQLQNNNANQLLRSIGYSFDDYVTEPVVQLYYEWLLMDPDVPNEEKGEYQIDAHGSTALVERAIQDQTIGQLLGAALNPAYGLNPKKSMATYLRSKKLDPSDMQYTEDEQAKIDAAPPPVAPAVQVAQINADTQLKLGVMGQQADQQTIQHEKQVADAANALEGIKVQADQQATHVQATIDLHELELKRQNALLDYATQRNISLDQAKAQLARTAMQLNVEQQLNAANLAMDAGKHRVDKAVELHKHRNPSPKPPVQVPGRAGRGQAFSQAPA